MSQSLISVKDAVTKQFICSVMRDRVSGQSSSLVVANQNVEQARNLKKFRIRYTSI